MNYYLLALHTVELPVQKIEIISYICFRNQQIYPSVHKLLTAIFLFTALLASAQENYFVTTDSTTYPIDDPTEICGWYLNAKYVRSTPLTFTSNQENITIDREDIVEINLEIPYSADDYWCSHLCNGMTNLTTANITFADDDWSVVGDYFCFNMFYECENLTTLSDDFTLPQSIIEAGTWFCADVFNYCSKLESLPDNFNLPQNVQTVGKYAFYDIFFGCNALKTLPDNFNIPQTLATNGSHFCYGLFYQCTNLLTLPDNFSLPQNLSTTDNAFGWIFFGCANLLAGENVELIFPADAKYAFSGTSFEPTDAEAGSTYYIKGNHEDDEIIEDEFDEDDEEIIEDDDEEFDEDDEDDEFDEDDDFDDEESPTSLTKNTCELIVTDYYDLSGHKLSEPQHGINIKIEYTPNGEAKMTKFWKK